MAKRKRSGDLWGGAETEKTEWGGIGIGLELDWNWVGIGLEWIGMDWDRDGAERERSGIQGEWFCS